MKVHVLTETMEGTDGLREFNIKIITENEQKAKDLLKELYEKDVYNYFAKGVECLTECYARSVFKDGFVEYGIEEMELEKAYYWGANTICGKGELEFV